MAYDNVTMATLLFDIDGESSTARMDGIGQNNDPAIYIGVGTKVTLSAIIVITMLGSIIGNGVVCVVVYQKPAMRSAINLLLANMALANILLSASCMPFALATLIAGGSWVFGLVMCRSVAFCNQLFISEAVFVLFLISIDRYLIIVQKRDKLTPCVAKLMIATTWCLSAALSLPPVVGLGLYRHDNGWIQCVLAEHGNASVFIVYLIISTTLVFYGPMTLLTYTYICIATTVRKHGKRVNIQSSLEGSITRLGHTMVAHPHIIGIDMSFKTRAFKTILSLFVTYVTCWLPYSIAIVHWSLTHTLSRNYLTGNVLLCLGYMNTSVNPCIYCWRIDKFRNACQELFPGTCRLFPLLPECTNRRINPAALYKVKE